MKMKLGILAAAAFAVILCGCGKSDSDDRQTKAEVRRYIIRKYSHIAPESSIRAALGEGGDRKAGVSFMIYLQKNDLLDEFNEDLDAYRRAK